MNYVFYLQDGGNAPQPQISEDELIQLVQAAMSGDSDAGQMLEQLMQADPSIQGAVEQIVQGLQQSTQSMKCGGRVKKKEMGSKIVKAEKAKCGCALRKVGGRLIEVDSCTDLPVHRNGGGIAKLQTAWGTIPNFSMPYNPEAHRDPLLDNIIKTSVNKKKEAEKALAKERNEKQATERTVFDGSFMAGGINYGRQNPLNLARTAMQNTTIPSYIITNLSTVKQPDTTVTEKALAKERTNVKQESPKTNQQYTPLFSGDLRSYGARRQWVTDNAEYLKSQGWDDARIARYRGSAADNIALQKAISGKAAWDAEQEVQAAQDQIVRTFYSKMSDSDKRALQDMLKSAGYYKGEINGLIGNVTLDALRKFQQDNKLTVDGMAGRNTFDALRAKTRQVAQPVTDPTTVPGYTQAMQLLNQMNGSASVAPVKTGGPTGGMGLNDVHQGRDVQLVGPKVGLNLAAGLEIPQRKQVGQLNYANYLN